MEIHRQEEDVGGAVTRLPATGPEFKEVGVVWLCGVRVMALHAHPAVTELEPRGAQALVSPCPPQLSGQWSSLGLVSLDGQFLFLHDLELSPSVGLVASLPKLAWQVPAEDWMMPGSGLPGFSSMSRSIWF